MAIETYTPPPFEVEVADLVRGKTHLKQKFRFLRLEHNDLARTATIFGQMQLYALAEDGGYGPALTDPAFSSYPVSITADNNRLVDLRDGSILAERYPLSGALTDAEWQAAIDRVHASSVRAMYQGDYFNWLRDNQPLLIGEVIRQYVAQADAAPSRFA